MQPATKEPATGPWLSWAEIKQRYPDEWVVLAPFERVTETDVDGIAGVVFAHGPERRDILGVCKLPMAAIRWTGKVTLGVMPWKLAGVARRV